MTATIHKLTDQQSAILAITFELAICVESVAAAISWLANDIRTNGLEREMVTIKALADDTKENLEQLQTRIWSEFGVDAEPAIPANDDEPTS